MDKIVKASISPSTAYLFKLRTTHKEWRIFFFFIYVTKSLARDFFFVELEVAVDVWKVNFFFLLFFLFCTNKLILYYNSDIYAYKNI